MIVVEQTRYKDGCVYPGARVLESTKAWEDLELEFGFGCQVKEVGPELVTVETLVMGCRDVTTYTGTAEDMKLLRSSALLYIENKAQSLAVNRRLEPWGEVVATMASPSVLKSVLLGLLGPKVAQELADYKYKQLLEAFMFLQLGFTVKEIKESSI